VHLQSSWCRPQCASCQQRQSSCSGARAWSSRGACQAWIHRLKFAFFLFCFVFVGVLVGLLLFHAHVDDLLDASVCGDIVGADGHLIEFLFFFFFWFSFYSHYWSKRKHMPYTQEIHSETLNFLGPGGAPHERLAVGADLVTRTDFVNKKKFFFFPL